MQASELNRVSELTRVAAFRAGLLLRGYFGGRVRLDVDKKSSAVDLVSQADRASEDLLRLELSAILPEAGFIGEESADGNEELRELNWVVDPLDGTSNFLSGLPIWAVSIALCDDQLEPVIGVIHAPILNRTWTAAKGQGAFADGKPIKVRPEPPGGGWHNAMLATGFPYDLASNAGQTNIRYFCCMQTQFHKIRRLGSAAIDLAYIAEGTFDGMWELMLSCWDTAAGLCLVREAGGCYTCLDGSHHRPGDRELIVAANPDLLETIREQLGAAENPNQRCI